MKEYLHFSNEVDLCNIKHYHHHVHGVDSMLDTLDCSHTIWKNFPKAWADAFQGKENNPSIVLKGFSDYQMFFGMILMDMQLPLRQKMFALSPIQECLLDDLFEDDELLSGVLPFSIVGEQFNKMFVLVDWIYMNFLRLVMSIKMPLTKNETRFTTWLEAM
ncbi:hypothetical protein ACHAW6_006572 [Cyclotella cf. meneghiniana]